MSSMILFERKKAYNESGKKERNFKEKTLNF